ncbi:hypothetical protein H6P81_019406 [Aristolochia fimbriata]|uniref:S-acyltransferase n=1 Tax=Aristolochia fimbriata TaxID=158543 RepID=A0AAV7DUP0_ARIFI|nr:hypothetical protein H6P81_019406 [Aristolochia fimbriata]
MILTTIVLINLIIASTRDPGIIPRQDQPPVEEVGTSTAGISSKWITVNGIEVKLKHCKICKHFRPPRSCHCAVCDNCVERFDHHCPWIGQCIGLRNYRYYLLFISSGLFLFIYFFSFSCERMKIRMSSTGAGIFDTAVNTPEAAALALFSMAAIVFLGGLTLYHAYLVMLNQTAYENYKQRKDTPNPYNKGILSNIKEALFTNIQTSRVNFQAEVVLPGWRSKSTVAAADRRGTGRVHGLFHEKEGGVILRRVNQRERDEYGVWREGADPQTEEKHKSHEWGLGFLLKGGSIVLLQSCITVGGGGISPCTLVAKRFLSLYFSPLNYSGCAGFL